MKFAVASVAFREERFIGHFVKHYKPLVDEIYILNSTKPWCGNGEGYTIEDETLWIGAHAGAKGRMAYWPDEQTQRNFGLNYLSNYDWIFILDPDEFFLAKDMERIKEFLHNANHPAYKVAEQRTYWKNGYAIHPPEGHRQIVAIKGGSNVKFTDKRGINIDPLRLPEDIILHHFSWARTNEEVWRKINHFSHAPEFDLMAWFANVWMDWTPGMTNLHPINPGQYQQAKTVEIPKELKHIMEGL